MRTKRIDLREAAYALTEEGTAMPLIRAYIDWREGLGRATRAYEAIRNELSSYGTYGTMEWDAVYPALQALSRIYALEGNRKRA